MSFNTTKRLLKELKSNYKEQKNLLHLYPNSEDHLLLWTAIITADRPFDTGKFYLEIKIAEDYPNSPPKIKFLNKVCHPNINFNTGEICLDLLSNAWSPIFTLKSCVESIIQLLNNPNPDSPLNCDAANLLRCQDYRGYYSLVQMYIKLNLKVT
ncbi:E2 ubiquitin-protein ligase peroxin 4 [Clydaea vesicula]|uniref:E2 ubiquitin-protein ligase peroxin 4 n=1 Tax=Clydaea vesicula TaxID=447962 RepID=A0AAD5U4A9_9FUNG|nr:E2 ubiquitin-protein ligase peroxin 4 [Clydaea vesicula]KAJ3395781.1 E2 ubiquitin-protein ligase peroxin 4 [Lobulomyces angularis]